MDDNLNYETHLLISSKKLIISVISNLDKKIYQEELILQNNSREPNFEKLDQFLNENIFKIEKKLKNFIKKTSVILDLDVFLTVEISIKKNNYGNFFNIKNLNHLLYEAKDCCKKTIDKQRIVHMVINNYQFDNKSYSYLPDNIKCNSYSLDIKFHCIPIELVENLEKVLKKYQISLSQVVNSQYVRNFLSNKQNDLFLMTKKVISGHNPNEVLFVDKIPKNKGFFEKFFNLFN